MLTLMQTLNLTPGFIRFNVGTGLSLHTQISWHNPICCVTLPIPLRSLRSIAGSDKAFHFLSSSRSPSTQHVDVGICVDLQCGCVCGLVARPLDSPSPQPV